MRQLKQMHAMFPSNHKVVQVVERSDGELGVVVRIEDRDQEGDLKRSRARIEHTLPSETLEIIGNAASVSASAKPMRGHRTAGAVKANSPAKTF